MKRLIAGGIILVLAILWSALIIIAGAPDSENGTQVLMPAFVVFAFFAIPALLLIRYGKAAVRLDRAVAAVSSGGGAGNMDQIASHFDIPPAKLENAIAVRRRADEAVQLKAQGVFSWSWPAACGLGLWALWHGIWCAFFVEIWSQKAVWAWIGLFVALTIPVAVFGSMPATQVDQIMPFWCYSVLMVFWLLLIPAGPIYLVYLAGQCGEMWLYIHKGIRPSEMVAGSK